MMLPNYVGLMARYNTWQNGSLFEAANTLSDAARRADRGAFFGSTHATLNHLLWADRTWMSRFAGTARPAQMIQTSVDMIRGWEELKTARSQFDKVVED